MDWQNRPSCMFIGWLEMYFFGLGLFAIADPCVLLMKGDVLMVNEREGKTGNILEEVFCFYQIQTFR